MSSVAMAQYAASSAGRDAFARRHQRDRIGGAGRRDFDPAAAVAVGEVGTRLEAQLVDVEGEGPFLVGDGDEDGPDLGEVDLVLGVGQPVTPFA